MKIIMDAETPISAVAFANFAIGKDLLKMRQKAGLSQTRVAKKAGIGPDMLCRIESGKGNPTVATVAKIVRAIKMLSR